MGIFDGFEPKVFFDNFEAISRIPRGSTHEEKISNYLKVFAESHGLEVQQDELFNLLIKKPGTPGYENAPALLLHGHMDMVLAKDEGVDIDLLKEGPHLVVDGDVVRAEGTTLGADNGVGVSLIMSLLQSTDIPHPPLEVIITAQEEVGKVGSRVFDARDVTGRRLIDLNWHNHKSIYAGCAGDIAMWVSVPVEYTAPAEDMVFYSIGISGLEGGHQGFDTHRGRSNAITSYFRIADRIAEKYEVCLVYPGGGIDKGVIPNAMKSVIAVHKADLDGVRAIVSEVSAEIKNEYRLADPHMEIVFEAAERSGRVIDYANTKKINTFASLVPFGVESMSLEWDGLVETSCAIAVVNSGETSVNFMIYIASMLSSRKYEVYKRVQNLAAMMDAKIEVFVDCPEWTYRPDSKLLATAKEAFRTIYNEEPPIELSHSSLEIGVFEKKLPGIEMISLGPKAYDLHTTRERFEYKTVQPVWDMLQEILKNLKD